MRSWIYRIVHTFAPPPVTEAEVHELQELTERGTEQDKARDAEIREVTSRLRRQREQNHFGPLIWAALRGESDV